RPEIRVARDLWGALPRASLDGLSTLIDTYEVSVRSGDVIYLDGHWYVTHTGLLGIARRNRCSGIRVEAVSAFCEPSAQRWAFEATVYKSRTCRGFTGFGDADPS